MTSRPFFAWRAPDLEGSGSSRSGRDPVRVVYEDFDRTQWLAPDELTAMVLARVRALLGHAAREVPYYRRLFEEHGIVPDDVRSMHDFRRLPLLERRLVQERFGELQARSLPAHMVATGTVFTSGSSGVPVRISQTNVGDLVWFAAYLRDLEWTEADPRGSLASIRYVNAEGEVRARLLEGVSAPTWEPRLHRLIETGPSFAMDIHQDPRRQLEWLYRITPDYLVSYPSNLEFLAGLIEESGRPLPGLKIIKSLSESLSAETLARVEAAFGVPVKNTYSCMEAGYLASPCPEGHGLHVHAENVLLEVLDDAGEPCPPGKAGRVVLTALHNFRMPLVRYEIMDEAAFSLERCPCGRGLPLLDRPIGKRHPLFRLPDGRSKNTIGLAVAMRKIGGTHQFRVVQRAIDRVLVRVVPDRNFNAEHERRIRDAMRDFFESAVHVTVETTERLELTASGKSPHLVSELENESGSRAPT